MKRTCMLFLMGIVGFLSSVSAQVRTEFLLEKGWKFTREDNPESVQPSFDDSQWQSVTVPHDWAIYGIGLHWIFRNSLPVKRPSFFSTER